MRCVPARDFTVAKALAWRSAIEVDPPYQRPSSIWTLDKQQLFIDSLLNGYDVPKIYLHDLRGRHPTRVYTVVDGKQRLTTIWRFLGDEFGLAPDFRIEPGNLPELPAGVRHPGPGMRFSELDPAWRAVLRSTYLAVVLIQNATEEDIEDLFARLNNGEPLNAAEKRNAIGGDMARLVREIASHPFFADRLRFPNGRYQHLDLAARLAALEASAAGLDGPAAAPDGGLPDLRAAALDAFVRRHRRPGPPGRALRARLAARLDRLAAVFESADPLLATVTDATLHALFVAAVDDRAGSADPDPRAIRLFLAGFQHARRAALERPDETHDPALDEFSHLLHGGPVDARSLERRLAILLDGWQHEAGRTDGA